MQITKVTIYPFKEGCVLGKIKALASVVFDDAFLVRGLRVIRCEKGLSVGYPNDPFYKGEIYHSICQPITNELREHIEDSVLEAYQKEVGNDQG